MLILERSLRVIGMIFGEESMRKNMKLQIELFLSFTLDRLSPPQGPAANGAPNLRLSVGNKGVAMNKHSSNLSISSSNAPRAKSPDPIAPSRSSISTVDESRLADPDDDTQSESAFRLPPRLGVPPARGEARELLMETLVHLALRQPSFVPDLWVNYDCDLNCEDIFDKLIAFLTLVRGHQFVL